MRCTPIDVDARALLRWIHECNNYTPEPFVDWVVEGAVVGAIHKGRLELLRQHPETFQVLDGRVVLHPRLDTPDTRTAAVEQVLRGWHEQGVFSGWRGERYAVAPTFGAEPLLAVERSAAGLFGFRQYGVHINGITQVDGEPHMWVARRSDRKPEYPGRLDHLVAGGLAVGMSASVTVSRECREEANIPTDLSAQARPAGLVSYHRVRGQVSGQVVLFVYDLELPATFRPQNNDGEVAEFYLWPVERVIETVTQTDEFKTNCNLVITDWLVRHGYLCPDDPLYVEIVHGLRGLARNAS
jgi:8-oxo-dGTP pyrophosphatase MutT (NUDIX family)